MPSASIRHAQRKIDRYFEFTSFRNAIPSHDHTFSYPLRVLHTSRNLTLTRPDHLHSEKTTRAKIFRSRTLRHTLYATLPGKIGVGLEMSSPILDSSTRISAYKEENLAPRRNESAARLPAGLSSPQRRSSCSRRRMCKSIRRKGALGSSVGVLDAKDSFGG